MLRVSLTRLTDMLLQLFFPLLSILLILWGYARITRSHSRAEPHVAHLALASIFFLSCFSAIACAVAQSGKASTLDYSVFVYFQSVQSKGMLAFMRSVSALFDPLNFTAFVFFFEAVLLVRKHYREALLSSSIFLFAFLLSWSVKVVIGSSRPFLPDVATLGYSFPSGHATLAAAFFLTLYIFARPHIKEAEQRIGLLIFALLCAGAVAASRLYLGVHWFSDAAGGLLLGTFSVFFLLAQFSLPTAKRKR